MNDSGGEVDNNKMERMKKIASLGKVLLMICVFVFAFLFVVRGSGGGDIVSTYYEAVTTSSSSLSSLLSPLEDYIYIRVGRRTATLIGSSSGFW